MWYDKGITRFKHLYVDGVFDSFANLSSLYGPPVTHLFDYFQIHNFVTKSFPNFPSLPPEPRWGTTLSFAPHHRGTISKLYDIILAFSNHSSAIFKRTWEEELGMQIQEGSWEQSYTYTGYISLSLDYLTISGSGRHVMNAMALLVTLATCFFFVPTWKVSGRVTFLLCPPFSG